MLLEQEKAQKDADMKIKSGDLQTSQKELDAITATVHQLETQRGEAQKRLDELDDKVLPLLVWHVFLFAGLLFLPDVTKRVDSIWYCE